MKEKTFDDFKNKLLTLRKFKKGGENEEFKFFQIK